MATKKQIEEFISRIAPCAVNAYEILGKVKPSVCIGMACVESSYGTAGSCKHNSFLGHKVGSGRTAKKYWDGKFFKSRTSEEYTVGVHTIITDAFRAYESMQQCVLNFYELMNSSLYKKVLAKSDYKIQMQQIKDCKYMTSSREVSSVLAIISKYGLTKYDDVDSTGNVEYYPAYEGYSISLAVALSSVGADSSYNNRKKIAIANGIIGYKGTSAQNIKLLEMLKKGKLIKV